MRAKQEIDNLEKYIIDFGKSLVSQAYRDEIQTIDDALGRSDSLGAQVKCIKGLVYGTLAFDRIIYGTLENEYKARAKEYDRIAFCCARDGLKWESMVYKRLANICKLAQKDI